MSEFDVVVVTVRSSEGEWLEEEEALGELDASKDHDGEYVGNDVKGEGDKESVSDAVADTLDVRSTDAEIDAEREPESDADDDLDTDGVDETHALADALRVTVPLLEMERVRVAQDETDGLMESERDRQAVVELDTVTDTRVVSVTVLDAEIDTECDRDSLGVRVKTLVADAHVVNVVEGHADAESEDDVVEDVRADCEFDSVCVTNALPLVVKDDERVEIRDCDGRCVAETDAVVQVVVETDGNKTVAVASPDAEKLSEAVGGAPVSEARTEDVEESVLEIELESEVGGVAVAFVDHVAVTGVGGIDAAGEEDGLCDSVLFGLFERRGESEFVVCTDAVGVKLGERVAGRDTEPLELAVIPDRELLAVGERVRDGDAVTDLEMDGDVVTLGDRETRGDAL